MRTLHDLTLDRKKTALVLVDFQERLFAAMATERQEETLKNTLLLLELAKLMKLPVLHSEQYPEGLGKTVPPVREKLPEGSAPFEKLEFSCWATNGFAQQFRFLGARAAILIGMECHVCVLQTVLDMRREGITVHVPRDGVISRTEQNRATGLEIMDRAGALVTSTETVIFQLLERAGTVEFKTLSKLVK